MRPELVNRRFAAIGLIGIATFLACIVVLHARQPELSPLDEAMSFYVHGEFGILLSLGLIALGVGSAALSIAASRSLNGPGKWFAVACLGIWSIAVIIVGIFPTDPPGNWDQPPSVAGAIHGIGALIALTAFPMGAVAFTRSARHDDRWKPAHPKLRILTAVVVVSYIAFAASLTPVFVRPGPPVLLGLTERIQLAAYTVWLAFTAAKTYRMNITLHASNKFATS